MTTKACEFCGAEFVDTSPAQNRRFCTTKCRGRARYRNEEYREKCIKRARFHYWKHPEINRAASRAWAEANRDRKREGDRAYRQANREKKLAYDRAYYRANRERNIEYAKKWAAANRDKRSKVCKAYRERNPVKVRAWAREGGARKRARAKGAFVSPVDREAIYARDNYTCQLCKKKVKMTLVYPHPLSASLDHILPLANGGTHEPKNVQLAHLVCNTRKKNTGVDQLRLFGE